MTGFLLVLAWMLPGILLGLRVAHVDPLGGERSREQYAIAAFAGAFFLPVFIALAFTFRRGEDTSTGIGFFELRRRDSHDFFAPSAPKPKQPWPIDPDGELFDGEHKLDALFDLMLRPVEIEPDHQIVVWTPEEREMFGHNDTLRFISETDRILKDIEWKQLEAQAKLRHQEMGDISTLRARPERPGLWAPPPRPELWSDEMREHWAPEDEEEAEVVELFSWGSPEPVKRVYTHPMDTQAPRLRKRTAVCPPF